MCHNAFLHHSWRRYLGAYPCTGLPTCNIPCLLGLSCIPPSQNRDRLGSAEWVVPGEPNFNGSGIKSFQRPHLGLMFGSPAVEYCWEFLSGALIVCRLLFRPIPYCYA